MTLTWSQLNEAIATGDTRYLIRTRSMEKLYRATPPVTAEELNQLMGERDYAIINNSYPYDLEAHHYILWSRTTLTHEQAHNIASHYFKNFLLYLNARHQQSVKHTFHYHIFVKL